MKISEIQVLIIKCFLCRQFEILNYFTILVDDKNYKWFCRLYFNREQKCVRIPDENKKEQKFLITSLGDIYKLKSQIIEALQRLI